MQEETKSSIFDELEFDHVAKQHIKSIAQWGMIIVALAAIGYIVDLIQTFTNEFSRGRQSSEGFGSLLIGVSGNDDVSTVVVVLVGLFLNFFLFRFCTQARRAIDLSDSGALGRSFSNLKGYFMAMAIITILAFLILLLLSLLNFTSRV